MSIRNSEAELIARIKALGAPSVLVINKMDTVDKPDLLAVMQTYGQAHDFNAILPISAKNGEGVEELLDLLAEFLPEGPQLFPEDMVTDQPERQVCAEIIREKLLLCLDKEIPHGTAVEITRFSEPDRGADGAEPGSGDQSAALHGNLSALFLLRRHGPGGEPGGDGRRPQHFPAPGGKKNTGGIIHESDFHLRRNRRPH